MEQQERTRPDAKTIKIWKHHLQDEIDASFLYGVFASLESDTKRKEILSGLAEVENRHVTPLAGDAGGIRHKVQKPATDFQGTVNGVVRSEIWGAPFRFHKC